MDQRIKTFIRRAGRLVAHLPAPDRKRIGSLLRDLLTSLERLEVVEPGGAVKRASVV